uniref:Amidase domain-containing protein n=1 Tax=Steinernema glaseri TaxID=37863 RepID=A0A1I7YCM9_9BILA
MYGCNDLFGLATVTTPMILPASMIGAATCITDDSGSSGSLRVERAPYSPRRV